MSVACPLPSSGRLSAIAILGPTASGKSALAMEVANLLPCEIINADSRQIYRHMNIGTAKPTKQDREKIPHHLLDVVDPDQPFSAGEFVTAARQAMSEILARGCLPLIVGGTGFYVEALCQGLPELPCDGELRDHLTQRLETEGLDVLLADLERLDPIGAHSIDRRNPRRVLRALEIVLGSGQPLAEARKHTLPTDIYVHHFLVTMPRPMLFARIRARIDRMLDLGLEVEIKELLSRYSWSDPGLQTIGYREWREHIAGTQARAETVVLIDQRTRQYAKRQETWFARRPGGTFWNLAAPEQQQKILEAICNTAATILVQNRNC